MTLVRAFIAVGVCTVVCTTAGVGLGVALGHIAPDFYRATLIAGRFADFDPVQVGIGFGLNAGVFSGIVIGLVVVAIVTYFELRTAERARSLPEPPREPAAPAGQHTEAIRKPSLSDR
jgi:hypothetical protein